MVFRYVDTPYRVTGKNPPDKNPPGKNPPGKIPLNAVEREPVETRVLNPNASEASYKPKQRSYKKTKLKKIIFLFFSGGFYPGTLCRMFLAEIRLFLADILFQIRRIGRAVCVINFLIIFMVNFSARIFRANICVARKIKLILFGRVFLQGTML